MDRRESKWLEWLIINILMIAIPIAYYSAKFSAASSIGSAAFVNSSFGANFFPSGFIHFWMVLMDRLGLSLYYNYLSLDMASLYMSIVGSYVFLSNIVYFAGNKNQADDQYHYRSISLRIALVFISLLMSANPFFANNYGLGVGALPFLMLSLASVSEAIKFKVLDWRFWSLAFLTGFLLILGYNGYILLPVYFVATSIVILVLVSYRVVPLLRYLSSLFSSTLIFFAFSGASGFLTSSLSGSLGGLFPYFRPLNLEHEYALLSVSGIFKAVSGLSFNVGFYASALSKLEMLVVLLLVLTSSIAIFACTFNNRRRPVILFFILSLAILLSLPYRDNVPIIGYIPLYLISNHIVMYDHFGEALSIFDANRLLLFLYWSLLPSAMALGIYAVLYEARSMAEIPSDWPKGLLKRYKIILGSMITVAIILIAVIVILSVLNGPYNNLDFQKSSPTYAYVVGSNDSYNRMLLYQNQNLFYPGNIYPSYMEMQADIPDKPMYVNFLNMESSPLIIPALNSLPPASFIYQNNTERIIHGTRLTDNFSEISNANGNVTAGYPAFVLGTQYTFDQYVFNNYFTKTNETSFKSYNDTYINYGRFAYYSIPNELLSYLNSPGGMIEINTDIKINSPIQNGTGFTFGISNASQYYPLGVNELGFGIGVFNRSTVPALLGYGIPITNGFNHSEYLSVGNAFSYNLEDYIPFQGNTVDNVSIVFYNSGINGIFGFIDYGGQWYQSLSNYSISQIRYFYSQAHLDSPSGIAYNVTMSELHLNNLYKNVIPIYYDSPFANLAQLIQAIDHSDFFVKGHDFSISDLIGSFLEVSGNSTIINPSAYSVQRPQDGWYQVFSDGAAQSSYSAEYIPPVIDYPVFGYNSYDGFAQSVINNSTFTVPVSPLHSGKFILDLNLLFSPFGGYLTVNVGGKAFNIDTRANSSYYGWYGINVSGDINSLSIRDDNGVQSINQIVLSSLSSYKYFVKLANQVLAGASFTNLGDLPSFNVTKTTYRASPVVYDATISTQGNFLDNLILEYSNPTYYSGFSISTTSSNYILIPAWASFAAIIVYNITGNSLTVKYSESASVYFSGYLPYLEVQGVWILPLIAIIAKRIKVRKKS
jgi:hypothetical protein